MRGNWLPQHSCPAKHSRPDSPLRRRRQEEVGDQLGFHVDLCVRLGLVVWVLFDYNMAFGPQWFPFLGMPVSGFGGGIQSRPGDNPRRGVRHAGYDVPDGDAGLLPVRVRRDHRDHPRRLGAWTHELPGLGDLLPGMDDLFYTVGAFSLWGGGWLAAWAWSTSPAAMLFILPLQPRVSLPLPWSGRDCNRTASISRPTAS